MIRLRNNKGNMALSLTTYISMFIFLLSAYNVINSANQFVSGIPKTVTNVYCLNVVEQMTVKEFITQIEDYTSMMKISEDTNTKVYDEMLQEMYNSMTTSEGQAVYISPQKVIGESFCDDEQVMKKLLSMTTSQSYEEFVGVKQISFDYLNPDSSANFQDGDIMYLVPIEIQINVGEGTLNSMSLYEISGIYATYVHQNEESIIMSLHSDTAEIRRIKHNEYTIT